MTFDGGNMKTQALAAIAVFTVSGAGLFASDANASENTELQCTAQVVICPDGSQATHTETECHVCNNLVAPVNPLPNAANDVAEQARKKIKRWREKVKKLRNERKKNLDATMDFRERRESGEQISKEERVENAERIVERNKINAQIATTRARMLREQKKLPGNASEEAQEILDKMIKRHQARAKLLERRKALAEQLVTAIEQGNKEKRLKVVEKMKAVGEKLKSHGEKLKELRVALKESRKTPPVNFAELERSVVDQNGYASTVRVGNGVEGGSNATENNNSDDNSATSRAPANNNAITGSGI